MTNGSIYKIISRNTDKIYIGSTTKSLIKRLLQHEQDYQKYKRGKCNYTTSFKILEFENYHIELIESIEFESKNELRQREGYIIKKNRNICVNRCIAGQTKQESDKIYRIQNRDKLCKSKKEYYIQNRDRIHKHNNESLNCACGKTYTRQNKSRHEKCNFHIAYIKLLA